MIVDDCSVDIPVRVCRYLSWRACGDCVIISAAFFNAPEAFCSPSAAITLALASLAASASAAIALEQIPSKYVWRIIHEGLVSMLPLKLKWKSDILDLNSLNLQNQTHVYDITQF